MSKTKPIGQLNADLAGDYAAIIQYLTYAAQATGPYRPQLSQFFLAEIDDQAHTQFLANKIDALGGTSTTIPQEAPKASSNREVLEAVLTAARPTVRDYAERAKEAEALHEKGLAAQLEDMVRDESNHSEDTERILRDWPV